MKIFNYKLTYVGIFFLIAIIFSVMYTLYKNKELNNFLDQQTLEAENRYRSMVLFPEDTSQFIFDYLINTPDVIDIFKNAKDTSDQEQDQIRKKLHKYLAKTYDQLKSYEIQQLHFHLPNNDSFLRFHRPQKFGDNLSKVRPTIVFTNKFKKAISGFEEGKIFNGYRFVYPLFDQKKEHIGSVEISHSISSFKKVYERSFNRTTLDIVIDKNVVAKKLFKSEVSNYEPSLINHGFLHQKSNILSDVVKDTSTNLQTRDAIKIRMKNYENFSVAVRHDNYKCLVSFIAIQNPVTKKNVAYAISFEKSEYLMYFYKDKGIEHIYLIFLALLISLVIYFIVRFNKELKSKLYNDALLDIYNRRFFEAYVTESCKKQKRNKTLLSLIMFDVDHFKNINDTYGHDIGDEALRLLVEIVQEHTRQTDVFSRWGGEEFMLLVDVNLQTAHKMAENLRVMIQKDTKDDERVPEFTCSFGIISLENIFSLDEALKKVDTKLYEAKETGRNKVVV